MNTTLTEERGILDTTVSLDTVESVIIPVGDVIVRERQRKVDQKHVREIVASFRDLGGQLQLQPIVVDGNDVLVDGAHRLEAAKQAGWTHISVWRFPGITDNDRAILELDANRLRKQLSPVELEEAWTTHYAPIMQAKAKKSQGTRTDLAQEGENITGNSSNVQAAPRASASEAVKAVTGMSPDTMRKITDVKRLAQDPTVSNKLRQAAERAVEKLSKPRAAVDPVHRALLELKEREEREAVDPAELRRMEVEARLDKTLADTSLLAERLAGHLGSELEEAARLDQSNVETLRGVRVALTTALARVVSAEARVSIDAPDVALKRTGSEVFKMLSELSMKALDLEVDDDRG